MRADTHDEAGRVVVLGRIGTVTRCAVPQGLSARVTAARQVEHWWAGPAWVQASVAARCGVSTQLLSVLGHDVAGSAVLAQARAAGFDAHLTNVMHRRSDAFLDVQVMGAPARLWVPGASAVWPGEEDCAAVCTALGPADVVVVDAATPRTVVETVAQAALEAQAQVLMWVTDSSGLTASVLEGADVVIVDEEGALQAADLGVHPASLLVLFGATGAAWNGQQYVVPGRDSWDGHDDAGATDAFIGALAAHLAGGAGRDEAVVGALSAAVDMLGVRGPLPQGAAIDSDVLAW